MTEVRIPIPVQKYFEVRDRLKDEFNQHAIPIWLSADSVIRTWAGLSFFKWFEEQNSDVEWHIGWGEIQGELDANPINAAVSHDFVDETYRIVVVMIFHTNDKPVDEKDEEFQKGENSLALLFKLAWAGLS